MADSKAHLLIVYHSQSGRNARLAYRAREGGLESGAQVRLRRAAEAGTRDLQWCQGLLLFTPEYAGYLPGGIKEFFDRTLYPCIDHGITRPYGLFLCSGNDGSNAIAQWQRIARAYPFKEVCEPTLCHGSPTKEHLQWARELGEAFATGLQMGVY
ncbi:flavodoxin [Spongiibacter nanhainus]|uniref:Flavodoxin n=1 Tax=Spongiibacter nanhainus TaxID=2794344 RepID=A0A7T4UP86_9GAMM|nr:NAD(P)H-dependent oxidoreductase [Spongiibacter nanhainus]QQD16778.1 flavodoxin [Spongiibacter nanhainus]